MTLAFHSYANLFPLIEGQEFYDLAEDIRANGLHDRIGLIPVDDGGEQILDGRNRYRALCWLVSTGEVLGDAWGKWAGEALTLARMTNTDDVGLYCDAPVENDAEALAFVLSKNLSRRHLSDSQRAMVAAEISSLRQGQRADRADSPIGDSTAAAMLNVSERSVSRARVVRDHGSPELQEAVKRGALAVSAASEVAAQPVERQAVIIEALTAALKHQIYTDRSGAEHGKLAAETKKALAPLIREIRADKIAAKKERRAEREAETGRKIHALPGSFYGVAIEDFEWHHSAWSEETGSEKSPSMHYETAIDAQTPEAIVARCAERFACLAEDCIIFKWVTTPHLAIGIKVLELQGFRYVTSLVWNKQRPGEARGPGYWFTGEHETVLVGVRGKVVPPATAHFRSNFTTPVGGHSEKPDHLHEIIEFHWPSTPKVEFNARRRRDGWAAWGFDAPDAGISPDALREAFVASRAARDAARLWDHPAIAGLHTVSMTRDYPGGVSFNVATCLCGWSFRCETAPFALDQDDAVDAHWREVIAQHDSNLAVVSPSGEVTAAAADATSVGASAAAAALASQDAMRNASGASESSSPARGSDAPYDAGDVIAIDHLAGSEWLKPALEQGESPSRTAQNDDQLDALELSERQQLKILSDFCHPQRDLQNVLGPLYVARGYAYERNGQWALRGAGWDRLRELEAADTKPAAPAPVLTEPYRAPQPSLFDVARQLDDTPPAEIVDVCLQTRLPVDGDELAEQLALIGIDAGAAADPEMLRHLVGKGLAHCGTTKVKLTDDGRAFLAQLTSPASVQQQGVAT